MAGQLVFPFEVRPSRTVETFVQAPCNEQALRFIARWPDWPAPIAALYGPKSSGKSHLAAIWASMSGGEIISACDVDSVTAGSAPTVIEDLDQSVPGHARDSALLALFESRTPILITARIPPKEWGLFIPDLRSRFESAIAFPIWEPDDTLLGALASKHFKDRQIEVPDIVIRRIVTQLERTPEAVTAFIARLDQKALADKRAITERLVLELLDQRPNLVP